MTTPPHGDVAPPITPPSHHHPTSDHITGRELAPTHRINLPVEPDSDDWGDEFEPPRVGRVEAAFLRWLGRFRFMREEFQTLEEKLEFAMLGVFARPTGGRRAIEMLWARTGGRFGTIACRWIEWAFFTGSVVRFLLALAGHLVAAALLLTIPPVHAAAVWLVQLAWWAVNAGEPVVD
jgi:hypothetical protein